MPFERIPAMQASNNTTNTTTTLTTTTTTPTAKEINPACIPIAFLSGLCLTLSAVVVAFPAQRARRSGSELSERTTCVMRLSNVVFLALGNIFSAVAIWMANAATAYALCTGSYLLTNMMIQTLLQIAKSTKNVVVGTLVLAASIATLPQIGPAEPEGKQDVLELLTRFWAITFILLSVLGQVLAFVGIKFKYLRENSALLLAYAMMGGIGTVLNNCIVKVASIIGLDAWEGWLRFIPFAIVYLVEALICVGSAIVANESLEDPSAFVPTTAGVNLILQCLAGLFIWEDGSRLEHPMVYAMIYFLILLGIYDISSFDFLGGEAVRDITQSMSSFTGRRPSSRTPSLVDTSSSRQPARAADGGSELTVRY